MQQKALFEQQKATDRELRNQSIIRHNTMAEHLKMLSPSHKLAQMIQTQLAMEEQLYNNRNFLTENMVQGTMAASDKLLAMLDDYWKNVKIRNFIAWTFFFGLLFVGVMIGIFCSIE